jgi:hypothetical protein
MPLAGIKKGLTSWRGVLKMSAMKAVSEIGFFLARN